MTSLVNASHSVRVECWLAMWAVMSLIAIAIGCARTSTDDRGSATVLTQHERTTVVPQFAARPDAEHYPSIWEIDTTTGRDRRRVLPGEPIARDFARYGEASRRALYRVRLWSEDSTILDEFDTLVHDLRELVRVERTLGDTAFHTIEIRSSHLSDHAAAILTELSGLRVLTLSGLPPPPHARDSPWHAMNCGVEALWLIGRHLAIRELYLKAVALESEIYEPPIVAHRADMGGAFAAFTWLQQLYYDSYVPMAVVEAICELPRIHHIEIGVHPDLRDDFERIQSRFAHVTITQISDSD